MPKREPCFLRFLRVFGEESKCSFRVLDHLLVFVGTEVGFRIRSERKHLMMGFPLKDLSLFVYHASVVNGVRSGGQALGHEVADQRSKLSLHLGVSEMEGSRVKPGVVEILRHSGDNVGVGFTDVVTQHPCTLAKDTQAGKILAW